MSTLLELLQEASATPDHRLYDVFADRCSVRARAGQVLYDAGDPCDTVYVLASGLARSYVGEGVASRTTMLIKGPAILGERDVLAGLATTRDTVRLMSEACIFTFSRAVFMSEWKASQALRNLLTDDLAQRYVITLRWMHIDASQLPTRMNRLLKALGTPQPSINALSTMLGLSRRSVFRALADLRDDAAALAVEDSAEKLVHTMRRDEGAPVEQRLAG